MDEDYLVCVADDLRDQGYDDMFIESVLVALRYGETVVVGDNK